MWITDFLEKIFPTKQRVGGKVDSIIIDIPVELYYKELAIYQASSLIGNAIGRSEFKVFENGKPAENHKDYYLLNVSPNANETASLFWHKVINRLIRKNEALIVDVGDKLYCADSFSVEAERPILGNIYSNVAIDNLTFQKKFTVQDSYYLQLDNVSVSQLIDGVYADYGKILSSAAKAFKKSNGSKYKLHINTTISGDEEFNKEFEENAKNNLYILTKFYCLIGNIGNTAVYLCNLI
jgi:HK97 family phage portal protein